MHTTTYIVSHRQQGQVPLDLLAVEGQAHVVAKLPKVRVQAFEKKREMCRRKGGSVFIKCHHIKQVGPVESTTASQT